MSEWPWSGSIRLPITDQNAWGSWMAPLMACIGITEGPILEIGAGDFSTPFLHHYCACTNRPLTTIESDGEWLSRYSALASQSHILTGGTGSCEQMVKAAVDAGGSYAVALVDGSPSETRYRQCLALRERCVFLVVHDFSGKECIDTFTPELMNLWPHRAQAPRPRYTPSSLVLGLHEIPWFPGMEAL